MMRLALAVLVALSMMLGSGPAFAAPSPDCPMAAEHSGAMDHEKMGCCTPECAVACPAAVLYPAAIALPAVEPQALALTQSVPGRLPSAGLPTTDPPPRTGNS